MKALELTLFLMMIGVALPIVAFVFPAMIGGIPTGTADLSFMQDMNVSSLSYHAPKEFTGNPIMAAIDQAGYYFNLFTTALMWVGKIMFLIVWAFPAMVEIFKVPVIFAAGLQVGIWFIYVIGWYQITKGDDWSGKR